MTWVEASSVGVASIALVISALTLRFQRTHNKLSVKPLLIFKHITTTNKRGVYIKNVGFSPAIIKSKTLSHNNTPIDFETGDTFEREVVHEVIDDGGFYGTCDPIIAGTVIEPGKTQILFEVSWHHTISDSFLSRKILTFLDATKLNITYKSLYNESFSTLSNSLITAEDRTLY